MDKVASYSQIQESIKIIKESSKVFITNFYHEVDKVNPWILNDKLFQIFIGDTVFFLRHEKNFTYLFYFSSSPASLDAGLLNMKKIADNTLMVVDIVGKETDLKPILEIFKTHSFYLYSILNRMSKSTSQDNFSISSQPIIKANQSHTDSIYNILYQYFDPLAEQLPTLGEIAKWISLNHILIIEEEGNIIGMLIYDLIGFTSYLRYWFVHPDHRDRKIGSSLLKTYFHNSIGTKRQLFWVICNNMNAIKRYEHYGFKAENLYDYILTNKNIHYERSDH